MRKIAILFLSLALLAGCSQGLSGGGQVSGSDSGGGQVSDREIDELILEIVDENFPGYPLVVSLGSIDPRIGKDYQSAGATAAVAILPGVYAPYNPAVPDPSRYVLRPSAIRGNCQVIYWLDDLMAAAGRWIGGYSCDSDFFPGSEEPRPRS